MIKTRAEQAGLSIEPVFHSLRHGCASALLDAGINVVRIQQHLGHAEINTTMRYVHLKAELSGEVNAALDLGVMPTPELVKV